MVNPADSKSRVDSEFGQYELLHTVHATKLVIIPANQLVFPTNQQIKPIQTRLSNWLSSVFVKSTWQSLAL